ncbi:MAG: ribonuclease III [Lachnospiraceae bacterium]|nr:ribonuclease III [Lachnospiraceae bacterium]
MLEERIGYGFRDETLFTQALTHSSYTNEAKNKDRGENYERLEYLGDAVLEMVTSDFLYHRYETLPEGELTRLRAALVCEESLFECATALSLSTYIRFGKGEEMSGGREKPSILADVTEALIGAIYLDGGIDEARRFIETFVLCSVEEKFFVDDAKTRLQEAAQRIGRETPDYRLVAETGPEHDKRFTSAVFLGERFLAEGTGRNKKASQQEAAKAALQVLCI